MKKFAALSSLSYAAAAPNPIRRVITLLQEMQKEISAEVEKERDMFEKFQCYCKQNTGDLDAKTKEAQALIEKTKAEVAAAAGQKKQLKEELATHKKEREQAKKDLSAATKKRAEEKATFDEATKDHKKTISDLARAIEAIEKGVGKAFLQTGAASYLRGVVNSPVVQSSLDIASQQQLDSFLQSGADYSSSSGEITGILKMIKQNIDDELGGVIGQEEGAVKAFTAMSNSLQELIRTSSESIEKKTELKGEVAVKLVEGKNKVSNTEKQLGDDLATKAELDTVCKDKVEQFQTRQTDAAAEVEAIGQAIAVLNNDDALDLFRKIDTKAPAALAQLSLLQVGAKKAPLASALRELNPKNFANSPAVAMLAFTASQKLKAGKVDFSKVLKMIDDMAALLKKEGEEDLKFRDDCNQNLNDAAAEQKELEHAIKGLNAEIEDKAATIDAQNTIIKKCQEDVKTAKTAMSDATEQRHKENEEFVIAVDLNKQAVELILKAKDKLNAYYNPDLVRKEQRTETSEEAAARVGANEEGLVQLPGDAPEIFETGSRDNKGQKSNSVLSLMDQLANELNNDTQTMEHNEQTAQKDYEKLSLDLAKQVADSNKSQNDAIASKAEAEDQLTTAESTLEMKTEEHTTVAQSIHDLHAQCDFILETFEERKTARLNEIAGLDKAKAILSGAKFE